MSTYGSKARNMTVDRCNMNSNWLQKKNICNLNNAEVKLYRKSNPLNDIQSFKIQIHSFIVYIYRPTWINVVSKILNRNIISCIVLQYSVAMYK